MNTLYPIFLKLEKLQLLIVGGGKVGTEKLQFILKNSPNANITLVASTICDEIIELSRKFPKIKLVEKTFDENDLLNTQIIIIATNNYDTNYQIYQLAKQKNILANVADTPELCDFYMSAVVSKGDLKIGISTNGKSPTMAKRLREFFEEILPDDIQVLIDNLNQYRQELKGNLEHKIDQLNKLTDGFKNNKD